MNEILTTYDNPLKLHQVLYKQHSNGAIGTWRIQVTEEAHGATMIVASAKVLGGQEVETVTEISQGKNIGRVNETTPLEQAIAEAKSKINKKLDNGYVRTLEEAQHLPVTNQLGTKKPMLAHPFDKAKNPGTEFYGQPKLDGHRCVSTVGGDSQVILYSRQGKKLEIPHIQDYWQMLYNHRAWNGQEMDGELYVHGMNLQAVTSFINKPENDVDQVLQHHIYDTMMDAPFQQRAMVIKNLNLAMRNLILKKDTVQFVHTVHLENSQEVDRFHTENLAQGYEGTILRSMGDTGYEDGKRSRSLLKLKNFQDAEFKIVDVIQGKPKYSGSSVYDVAIYVCESFNGKRFQVTAPGTMQEKHTAWIRRHEAIGRMLTVKYFNLTPDGLPFHPVALRIRNDV